MKVGHVWNQIKPSLQNMFVLDFGNTLACSILVYKQINDSIARAMQPDLVHISLIWY